MELYGLKKISSSCNDLHEACPYTLEQVIQKGKNSVRILKAFASETNETVAIKLFPKSKQGQPMQAFLGEQGAIEGLSHSHILKYYEIYSDAVISVQDGQFVEYSAIVMEYVPFGDLYEAISKRPFSEKLARTLFRQMVSAVGYLHKQELTHLDLKLENFLVVPSHGVKLIDFESCQNISKDGKVLAKGTPGYRAPEVLKENVENPKALDIYSLGIVLFMIVTGTPPYVEEQESGKWKFDRYYEALRKDTNKFWNAHEKYRKSEGKETFSGEFKEFIEALLSLDPNNRPTVETIQELKWYKGEVYDNEGLEQELSQYVKV